MTLPYGVPRPVKQQSMAARPQINVASDLFHVDDGCAANGAIGGEAVRERLELEQIGFNLGHVGFFRISHC